MEDWGDSDEDLDLDALDLAEQQAIAQRQAQPATAQGPPAACAAPPQQQTEQPPRSNFPQQQPATPSWLQGPPRTASELCRRCHLFRSVPPRLQRPSHDKCPGVYGRGCGGDVQLVRWGDGRTFFWACSKADCAYREFPPPRKLVPELSILLERHQQTVAVGAAPGAEEAVAWCGGVAAVLRAAGVDLRRALSVPAEAPPAAPAAAPTTKDADPEAMRPKQAPAACFKAAVPEMKQEGAQHAAAAEEGAAPQSSGAAAPVTALGQAAGGPQLMAHKQCAASTAQHDVVAQELAAAERDAQQQQQAAVQRGTSADKAPPAPATAQAAGASAPDAPPDGPGPPELPELPPPQPVIFPWHEYERLSAQLQQFGRQFGVCLVSQQGLIPPPTLRAARGQLRTLPTPAQVEQLYGRMPRFLERALLPFQREGVLFGLAHGGRCLIADEMGVGKTVQAIALASCYQDEWPLLVVVPASLRLVWAEELEKWLPHLRPSCIHVIEGKEHRVAQGSVPHVCITSYEMMQRLTCDACKGRSGPHTSMCAGQRPPCTDPQNCMASLRWRVVIVDESHTLRTSSKPPDALHTEAVVAALRLARRAILLTGTPSLSCPFDLFRQVDAILPGLLGRSRIEFATAYCNRREVPLPGFHNPGERRTRMDVRGLSRGTELHDMLKAEVMLRRLKQDVLSQLPPKRRQVIRLPKPGPSEWPKLAKGRRQHADDSEGSASDGGEDEDEGEGAEGEGGGEGGGKPMSAAHRTGLAKCSSIIDWLMTALGVRSGGRGGGGAKRGQGAASGQDVLNIGKGEEDDEGGGGGEPACDAPKLLVFAHHKTVMNRLAAALEGAAGYAPVGYVRIDGSTDPEDRRTAVRRFRCDASIRVALLSVTAAGVGLDFSSASVVVFAELPDEVALVRQAEDRAHRQGQGQPVNVYFLCAKGTTDDRRWQALNRSLARVAAVHDGTGTRAPALAAATAPCAGAAWLGDGASGAEAAPGARRGGGATPQAGLVVECVYDAEAAGLTQAAAIAGRAAGSASPGQAGASHRPPAGEGTAQGAAGGAAGAAAPGAATAAAPAQQTAGGGTPAAQVNDFSGNRSACEPGSSSAAAAQAALLAAPGAADTPVLASTPPGLGFTPADADLKAPGSSFVAATDEPGSSAGPASVAAAGSPPARAGVVAGRSSPASAGCRQPPSDVAAALQAANSGSPLRCTAMSSNPTSSAAKQPEQQPAALAAAEVWFEVSGNTGRVHLHAAPDGSAPLWLSLPMEALLGGDSPPLEELLEAVSLDGGPPSPALAAGPQGQQGQQQGEQAAPAAGSQPTRPAASKQQEEEGQRQHGPPRRPEDSPEHGRERQRPAVIGGIGVLALDRHIGAARLAAMLAEAREFAAEWRELRGLHQSRLQGRVLRVPLTEAVEEVDQAAAAAGRLGMSANRFLDTQRADLALPPGAQWRPVRVAFKRYGKECEYQQPFMPDGARLCINCTKPVPGKAAAQPADAMLDGMTLLFCSGECEGRFALKSNGSAYRRALFRLERGVCVKCRLDCHALVKRLQAVEKGSRNWEAERRRIIAAHAPRLVERGYKAYLDLLIRRAVEGNAWQADHILPVYEGGGLCDVDNLHTLCVACHADVTKQQARERAAGRKQAGAAGAGGSGQPGWEDVAREGGQPVVKRRKKLQRVVLDADESGGAQGSLAAPAGVDRGKQAVAAAEGAAAAQAAGAADPGTKWRPRKRLKPLFAESEGVDAAAEADGGVSAAQPPAAPKAGVASGLESGGSPSQQGHTRQRRRLKPLFAFPGEELPGALPAAAAEASGTSPDAAAARSSHRLARSSTAEEPVTVQLGAAGAPLPLQAANGTVVAPGGIAENACPRSALA